MPSETLLLSSSQRCAQNVGVELQRQPLSGERFPFRSTNLEDNARPHIRAQNLWDRSKRTTFFDESNSDAPSNCSSSSDACYRRHEREKKRSYEQRILEVEHGTFTPLVLSSSGGWDPSVTVAYKRLVSLISKKYGQSYSSTISWIRCRISHSLIDSAVACLRAPRSSHHALIREIDLTDRPPDLFLAEV